jgi:hypothetical protein
MSEVFEEKLLKEGSDGSGADADEDIVDGDLSVVFFAAGIVEAGDPSRCEVAEYVGVVRLPVTVVPFADNDSGDGVESTGLSLGLCRGRSSGGPDAEATGAGQRRRMWR